MIEPHLPLRDPWGHKNSFGHALLIAGQKGMAGAALLAAEACMRMGVGKTTLHTPSANRLVIQIGRPEVIVSEDNDSGVFASPLNVDAFSAVGIGPGLGMAERTARALEEELRCCQNTALVLDADALNLLAVHADWWKLLPPNTILTPHVGEMKRLLGTAEGLSLEEMEQEASRLAMKYHVVIALKSHRTGICMPNGEFVRNETGNAGMATAGSGDVLTGMITSLLAQGMEASDALKTAVHLHGLAGDIAKKEMGERAMLASDIIKALPMALKMIENN